jgi:hypothetical protein
MKTSLFLLALAFLAAENNFNSNLSAKGNQVDSYLEVVYNEPVDTYYLESFPLYDMDGNLYIVKQAYTRIPTKEDSIEFLKNSQIETNRMYDSVQRRKREMNSKKSVKSAIKVKS